MSFLRIFPILEISAKIQESLASLLLLLFLLLLTSLLCMFISVADVPALAAGVSTLSDIPVVLPTMLVFILFMTSCCFWHPCCFWRPAVVEVLAVAGVLLLLALLLLLAYLPFWLSLCTKSIRRLDFRTITIGPIFILHDSAIGISKSDRR